MYIYTSVVCINPYCFDDSVYIYCVCARVLVHSNNKFPRHALYLCKRALLCTLTRCTKIKSACSKEPSIITIHLFFTAKEPCIPATKLSSSFQESSSMHIDKV